MFFKRFQKSGQATVEYLLLAVIVILIARVILTPLGQALGTYSTYFMGPHNDDNNSIGFYGCMMENGLLPLWSVVSEKGVEQINCGRSKAIAIAGLKDLSTNIDDNFKKLPTDSGSGGSPGSENSSNNSSNNSSEDGSSGDGSSDDSNGSNDGSKNGSKTSSNSSKNKNNRSGNNSSSSGISSDGGHVGDTQTGNPSLIRLSKNKKGKKGKKRKKGKRKGFGRGGGDEYEMAKQNKSKKGTIKVERGVGYLGDRYEQEQEEQDRPAIFEASGTSKKNSMGDAKRKGASIIVSNKEGKQLEIKDDSPFNFSQFLKYLIIAAIIVAILTVVFSQAMEFQSRE